MQDECERTPPVGAFCWHHWGPGDEHKPKGEFETAARVLSNLSGVGWSSVLMTEDNARAAVQGAMRKKNNLKFVRNRRDADSIARVDWAVDTLGLHRFI